jgi:hypothetical protein
VAASFLFPFRRPARLLLGALLMAVFPLSFVVVFGYAVSCIRAAAADPSAPPPVWRLSRRLLTDGLWSSLQALALTLPFALLTWLLTSALRDWRPTESAAANRELALTVAATVAAFPWGLLMLLVLPPTLARFAHSGRPADLFAVRPAVAFVRSRYAAWNVVLVGITTAWILALASLLLAGVGILAGAFYAILVCAHACAALSPDSPPPRDAHRPAG